LCSRNKVFSEYNGNIDSKILFVAEAPGRLGADKTNIPLYGDRTGDNFDLLLRNIKWTRDDIFITNAVLCNPRNDEGNNDKPTIEEIKNCNTYLEMTINLMQPELIVTLGLSALNSLRFIDSHNYSLKECVGKILDWNKIKIMPLYHPGPRAVLHRSIAKQRSDFIYLANNINPLTGFKKHKQLKNLNKMELANDNLHSLVLLILDYYKNISYFKLTKLLYLVDLYYITNKGYSFTNEIYLRQKDGPWPPALNKKIKYLEDKGIISQKYLSHYLTIFYNGGIEFDVNENDKKEIINIIDKYKKFDNAKIKFVVYRTKPMSFILTKEKEGLSYINKPVIFNNKTVLEL
jgi:uracil-DNA glycosylase family 4